MYPFVKLLSSGFFAGAEFIPDKHQGRRRDLSIRIFHEMSGLTAVERPIIIKIFNFEGVLFYF
jgi:hypothetical protein